MEASSLSPRRSLSCLLLVLLCLGLASCSSFSYDLQSVSIPVSAKPLEKGATGVAFRIEKKTILWGHGLFGESIPDVASLVQEAAGDGTRITDFRVKVAGSFHDWLLTHLTLTMMRMKTVVIEGNVVR